MTETLEVSHLHNAVDPGFGDEGTESYEEANTADKQHGPTRLTLHVPTESTILSLGAETEKEEYSWKGTVAGITAGTAGKIFMGAGESITMAAVPMGSEPSLETTEHAVKAAETVVKGHEGISFALGLAELALFATPSPSTALSAALAVEGGLFLASGLFHAPTSGASHKTALVHGEGEALMTSSNTVVTAAGRKNVVVGGAIAELSAGVTAEVKGIYSAGVCALGTAELRAVGKAEVLAKYKAELAARDGTAEVVGRSVEIGVLPDAAPPRQTATENVEIKAQAGIALEVKDKASNTSVELSPSSFLVEAANGGGILDLSGHGAEIVGSGHGHKAFGIKVTGAGIRLAHIEHLAHPDLTLDKTKRAAAVAAAKKSYQRWQAATAGLLVSGVAAIGVSAREDVPGGGWKESLVLGTEGLAAAAAAATSKAEAAYAGAMLAAEQAYAAAQAKKVEKAREDAWKKSADEVPQLTIDAAAVTAKVKDAALTLSSGDFQVALREDLRLQLTDLSKAKADAAKAAQDAEAALAAAKAKLKECEAAATKAERLSTNMLPALRAEARFAAREARGQQSSQERVVAQCEAAKQRAQNRKNAIKAGGAVLQVGKAKLVVTDAGVVQLKNPDGHGWEVAQDGSVKINDALDILP